MDKIYMLGLENDLEVTWFHSSLLWTLNSFLKVPLGNPGL